MRTLTPFIAIAALLISGCGDFHGSISDLSGPIVFSKASMLNGAVTSNQDGMTIESGYFVQSSSGAMTDRLSETTDGGYTIFTSTQGALFTDVVTETVHSNQLQMKLAQKAMQQP